MAREQVKLKKGPAPVEIGKGVLVKNGARVANDPWRVLADDEQAADGEHVVVPLARYLAEHEALSARGADRLGVVLEAADAAEELRGRLQGVALVMVRFPAFKDGRGFTTARLLRERFGYAGELRAVGEVLEDQIFYMLRCGFDAFEIIAADPEAAYTRAARSFSIAYQAAADRRKTIIVARTRASDDT